MCIYSYDAFLWLKTVVNCQNRYTGNGWDFFAWDFMGLSQSAAKHTTRGVLQNGIWKSSKLAVINIHCNIAMKSVTALPRSRFPMMVVSKFQFRFRLTDYFKKYVLQHLLNINKSSEAAQSSRDKSFCTSTSCSLLSYSNCKNRFTSVFNVTASLCFLQRIG